MIKGLWDDNVNDFIHFLRLEKSLSENSVQAYLSDISKLIQYFEKDDINKAENEVTHDDLTGFLKWINELGMHARSQARVISGVKAFFRFLLMDERINNDPTSLLEAPKIGRKLPDVLSTTEIDSIINQTDLSKPEGHRNRAIIEVLYSCGLRVSELTGLRISDCFFEEGFIRVIGKGDKQRLVPIGEKAILEINNYLPDRNKLPKIEKKSEDILFLNRRGAGLSREMIFMIVRDLCEAAGIKKKVSPHTFRHSFASDLIKGGADLRAVQEMLGHESILTTEIYTHLDRKFLSDTIRLYHPRSGS